MKHLFYCILFVGLWSCKQAENQLVNKQEKPNVVLFYLDDSAYGDVAHNGNPTIKTPNITKLKESGVNFTQFYVSAAACSASRYSLLTGRYPGRSGLGWWVISPGTKRYLHTNELTLAEGLKSVGYKTGMFGKWHLGTPNEKNNFTPDALPLAHGFDEWLGTNVSHDYNNAMLLKSDPNGNQPAKGYSIIAKNLPSDTLTSQSLTGVCTKAAVEFIQKNKSNPFFAYIPYNMPHLGLFVSDRFKGVSRNGELGDVMEELDAAIGEVCNALEKAGVRDNTIVIFSSDNGPWVKWSTVAESEKYGDTRLKVGYATPFRDGKGSTWEGGHRVPGIISWPAKIKGNRNEQTPITTLDILPTILSIAGADLPKDRTIDGRDLSAWLTNESTDKAPEEFKFFYSYDDNMPSAIRKNAWKLHTRIGSQTGNNYGYEVSKEAPILFQVEQDLGERIDVAEEKTTLVGELLTEFNAFEEQLKSEGSFWDDKQ
ncbi:sulfatase family protein [Aestuariibaculum sediminum]|uniref:Sulfatase n=1 Tax=Aestuariibaculum sediminum TaxID=2770637 RepID=A0A8J6UDU0_9FLAO|nr:sulfatase [Aestuariibaculum sediminum]MBD0833159.1 sulfatase [Aestuariibaculum sediminum]